METTDRRENLKSVLAARDFQVLGGTLRYRVPGAKLSHGADATEQVTVTVVIRRNPSGPPVPTLDQQWVSPNVTREQFGARYGAAVADMNTVIAFAAGHELVVLSTNAVQRSIVLEGTVASMAAAFGVNLNYYRLESGEHYRGREGLIYIPSNLIGVVLAILGLDGRPAAKPEMKERFNAALLTPPEVAKLYNFSSEDFPSENVPAQTIALMEFGGGYRLVDLQKNLAVLGLEVPTIHISSINGATNTSGACGTYDKEVLMDIYIASSVAPGAQLVVYFAPPDERGWYDAIMAAIHPDAGEPVPTVLSISWRLCDGDVPDLIQVFATVAGVDAISSGFQDAALLGSNGPTIFVSSGDAGSQANQGRAYVHYPASDPWVTACGGTEIGNVNGSVFDERTWESSGGGVSDHFNVPFYQSSAGINPVSANGDGRRGRGVPDVAGNASQASGYNVQCGDSSFTASQTSAVPPLYAGLLARVNAALGRQIGFLNPVLYANGSTVCRDLKDGICNGQTPPFYVSGPGWDLVTGWGSIDGLALLRVLRSSKSERRTTRCSQRAKYNR